MIAQNVWKWNWVLSQEWSPNSGSLKFIAVSQPPNWKVHNYRSVSNRHRLVLSSLSLLPLIVDATLRLQGYVRAGDNTLLSGCRNIPNVRLLGHRTCCFHIFVQKYELIHTQMHSFISINSFSGILAIVQLIPSDIFLIEARLSAEITTLDLIVNH